MLWFPTPRLLRVIVAWPLMSVNGPWSAPSMKKLTVPAGVSVAPPSGDTVAVNVTDWPKNDGLTVEVTPVLLLAWLTVSVWAGDDWLLRKFVLPLYLAT